MTALNPTALQAEIAAKIYQNTGQHITGATLQGVCEDMAQSLGSVNVDTYGAKGDGVTDDTAAINAATAAAVAAGIAVVDFSSGKTYLNNGLVAHSNLTYRGNGATLLYGTGPFSHIINGYGSIGPAATLTADVSAGDTVFSVNTVSGLNVGDDVLYRMGENPLDTPESSNWGFATITALGSNSITLDTPIAITLTISSVTNPLNKSIQKVVFLENMEFNGFNVLPTPGALYMDSFISVTYARNIRVKNITITDPGACVVGAQYARNVVVDNIYCDRSKSFGNQNAGQVFRFAEADNCFVSNVFAKNLDVGFGGAEDFCSVKFTNIYINNASSAGIGYILFSSSTGSNVFVDNLRLYGSGNISLLGITGASYINFKDAAIIVSSEMAYMGQFGVHLTGTLYYEVAGVAEYYSLENVIARKVSIPITANMSGATFSVGYGYVSNVFYRASSAVNASEFHLYFVRGSHTLVDVSLTPGSEVISAQATGTVEGAPWTYRNLLLKFVVNSNNGINPIGKYVAIEVQMYPNLLAAASQTMPDDGIIPHYEFLTLPSASLPLTGSEVMAVEQGSVVSQVPIRDILVRAAAAPTTGTWALGDIVWNSAPAGSGTIGWVCTAAGTPGTWKTFGAISV